MTAFLFPLANKALGCCRGSVLLGNFSVSFVLISCSGFSLRSFTGGAFGKKEIKQNENAFKPWFYVITLNIWVVKFRMLNSVTCSLIAQFIISWKAEIRKQVSIILFSLFCFKINNKYITIEPSLFKSNNCYVYSFF